MIPGSPEQLELEELRIQLSGFQGYQADSLVRLQALGTAYSFENERGLFEMILQLIDSLSRCDFEGVPLGQIETLRLRMKDMVTALRGVQNFTPATDQPNRNQMIAEIRQAYHHLYLEAMPVIASSAITNEWSKKASSQLDAIDEKSAALVATLQSKVEEANTALAAIHSSAAKVGVAVFADVFKTEAAVHATARDSWLTAVKWLAAVTFAAAVALLAATWLSPSNLTPTQAIQLAIAKLITFSILYAAVMAALKTYRAHAHNYVVNKHRENAMVSFEAFVEGTSDPVTKNAVLLQTTQSIFAPQPSGFISNEGESSVPPQIVEIFKAVGKDGK